MSELLVAESSQSGPVANLLAALGCRFAAAPLEKIETRRKSAAPALLLSELQFVELCKAECSRPDAAAHPFTAFENVLVYPFRGTAEGIRHLQSLVGGRISVSTADSNTDYSASGDRSLCGPFAGLPVKDAESVKDFALNVAGASVPADFVVTSNRGSLFTRFSLPGLNLFVASTEAVFDVNAEHFLNLDVRKCFSELAPLLFFLRHCGIDLPVTSLRWAHWIVDDPNLRPRYGFLDLRDFARAVRETGAAASIAFIPWNHRRTKREIVDLFKDNWPQVSICVHGCDHTGSEFSTRTMSEAAPLIDLAMKRMSRLEAETSLTCDPVMVFPQGKFSLEAMRALRDSTMLAAVNTELVDCQTGRGIKGGELLKPAITSLGGFPLFMRRPAEEASANFALDLVLGKPCLIVTHHQYFEHGLNALRSRVETLNALEPEMTWTNLEQGIVSTYSVSKGSAGQFHLRLYGARSVFVPQGAEPVVVTKAEGDPESVRIFVDGSEIPSTGVSGDIQFVIKSSTGLPVTIEARRAVAARSMSAQSPKYRLKVMARRYLTEVRDNYLCRFPMLNEGAVSVRRLLR